MSVDSKRGNAYLIAVQVLGTTLGTCQKTGAGFWWHQSHPFAVPKNVFVTGVTCSAVLEWDSRVAAVRPSVAFSSPGKGPLMAALPLRARRAERRGGAGAGAAGPGQGWAGHGRPAAAGPGAGRLGRRHGGAARR